MEADIGRVGVRSGASGGASAVGARKLTEGVAAANEDLVGAVAVREALVCQNDFTVLRVTRTRRACIEYLGEVDARAKRYLAETVCARLGVRGRACD